MRDDQRQPVYDVILSGAGPVGLFLACELALAKCSVLVLEMAETPESPLKRMPFGLRGLNAPSIEALYRRGLLEDMEVPKRVKDPHAHPAQGARRQGGHFAGIPLLAGNIDAAQWPFRLPGATAVVMLAEMEELETVLARRAEALGVEVLRGLPITHLEQQEQLVTVCCEEQRFHGEWLVGCDGARSAVRKAGGFAFTGTEPEFTGYSVHVELADPEKLMPGRHITGRGMYLQSQPGYLILQDFDGGAFHHEGGEITLEHVQEVLRRISGIEVTVLALHLASTWTDRARQATTYRNGRVLLAGDAAHIHAPLGGQGLNLGLGDAMNLGWKLAATVHKSAPEGLLDSYQRERHPVGEKVLEWSRAQVAIMRPDPAASALYTIFRDLMATRDGATYVAGRLWGVTTHYDLGDDHPLVGHSVPNFAFVDGTTAGEAMRDGRGLLIDFDGRAALRALATEFGASLRYLAVPATEQLGLRAVLVRPDGVVAWATSVEPNEDPLKEAIARWLPRKDIV